MNELPPLFVAPPSVYAVGGAYCVCVAVSAPCTMAVECGGKAWYDHANGILRSGRPVHLAWLPQSVLDEAGSYTVRLRPFIERKPYFSETGDVQSFTVSSFKPCNPQGGALNVVLVADTHSLIDAPIAAAAACGKVSPPDLLVLCGDIPEDCGDAARMTAPHLIAGRITGGAFPCVFARGNHDLRGSCAEQYAELTPTDNGRSFYEFRAGPAWGVVLDMGEDKPDDHPEYGHTVCCEAFREDEERWLRTIARRGAPADAKYRLVICHTPLAMRLEPPFDIEGDRLARWCSWLRPLGFQAMLSGHLHECWLESPGGRHDDYGAPCTVVCASLLDRKTKYHAVGLVSIAEKSVSLRCIDSLGSEVAAFSVPETSRRTDSAAQTQEFAKELAESVGPGLVWALSGDLGAGKTRFVQGLCDGLGTGAAATSPTFAIANEYGDDGNGNRIVHLDLYRLSGPDDLESIGWDDYLESGDTMAVEWPERAGLFLPQGRVVYVTIDRIPGAGPDARLVSIRRAKPALATESVP